MDAMVIDRIGPVTAGSRPLSAVDLPEPEPGPREIVIRVAACGVCHTELDEIEGRTPPPRLPVVPGHQVVGRVAALGPGGGRFRPGDRVGVAWIFSACGTCGHCRAGNENLCPRFRATGRDADGGYARFMKVGEAFAFPIPAVFSDAEAAPLLCAGGVGFRALRLTGLKDGQRLGLTGFGASAHLVLKLVHHHYPATRVSVFARSPRERQFARELGAVWAGDTAEKAPEPLDAVIDTTPAWKPVVAALGNLKPGGCLVINAIRKEAADREELLRLDYTDHLWMEKQIRSVANVARSDVVQFLELAAGVPLKPEYQAYDLAGANQALVELKTRKIRGAKVLCLE